MGHASLRLATFIILRVIVRWATRELIAQARVVTPTHVHLVGFAPPLARKHLRVRVRRAALVLPVRPIGPPRARVATNALAAVALIGKTATGVVAVAVTCRAYTAIRLRPKTPSEPKGMDSTIGRQEIVTIRVVENFHVPPRTRVERMASVQTRT